MPHSIKTMIRMKPLIGSVFVPEMPDQAEVDSIEPTSPVPNDSVPEMIP
jgi:hypothetical protein